MPNGISKRQQLRNEKALAELIRTVPGNDRCADCDALTPGWASWNMGIFLCMRCAAIHRKLGTHISKVKSLSMDTWSAEQVDSMKSHGNLLMNKIYNPKNIKPPVPTDVDEADSCMERFIRQKYQYRSLEDGKPKPPSREDESYTRSREDSRRERERERDISPEGSPPPLPPKSGKFFGFGLRSSSSTSNLRRFGTKSKASPTSDQRPWSPPPPKKTSGLGAPVADVTTDSFEAKMAALREMGFSNDRRNEMVLRGLNENLDKSIETLLRLGEGNDASSRARTAAPATTTAPAARATTPNPPKQETTVSLNPFDRVVSNPVPQQQQTASYNPFDRPTATTPASAQPLESSFQNLHVSQPLFPHSTGGYPAQTGLMPQTTYQQPYTPPVTATFTKDTYISSPQALDNSYNPFFQTAPQQNGLGSQSYPNPGAPQNNPFFNNAAQHQQQQQQPVPQLSMPHPPQHANTMPSVSSSSPFGNSPFGSSPFQSQPPQQQQQQQPLANGMSQGSYNPFQQAMGQTPQNPGGYPNQFQQPQQQQQFQSLQQQQQFQSLQQQQQFQPPHQQQQFQPQQQQQFQPQQPQQLAPQPTGRMDKNSILSLYNLAPSQPSSIPPIPEQSQFQPGAGTSPVPPLTNSLNSTPQTQPGSNITTPQPSNGMTSTASRNPFGAATVGSGLAAQAGIGYQQSPGLGIGMGANGTQPSAQGMGMGMGMGMKPPTQTGPPPSNSAFPRMHMSQPSVDINGLQTGRHSPDAFASLSARYG